MSTSPSDDAARTPHGDGNALLRPIPMIPKSCRPYPTRGRQHVDEERPPIVMRTHGRCSLYPLTGTADAAFPKGEGQDGGRPLRRGFAFLCLP